MNERRISPGFILRPINDGLVEVCTDQTSAYFGRANLASLTQLLASLPPEAGPGLVRISNDAFWATRTQSIIEVGQLGRGTVLSFDDWELGALVGGLSAWLAEWADERAKQDEARITALTGKSSDDRVSLDRADLLALLDIEAAARYYFDHHSAPVGGVDSTHLAAWHRLRETIERYQP